MAEITDTCILDVVNEALALLKEPPLSSIDKDSKNNNASRTCGRLFDSCRKTILREHDWGFARCSINISVGSNALLPIDDVVFGIPPDSIRILSVRDTNGNPVKYRIEGQSIKCSQTASEILYTQDIEDVDLWDSLARNALIFYLASQIAEPLTGRTKAWERLRAEKAEIMTDAKLANAREQHGTYDMAGYNRQIFGGGSSV